MDILKKIDYPKLREQKAELLHISEQYDKGTISDNALQGVIQLIDSIQDNAVDVLGRTESEVFGLKENFGFVVQLTIIDGSYEKNTTHIIQGADEIEAQKKAIENEAHGELEWLSEFFNHANDNDEFIYEVYKCVAIDQQTFNILNKYI